MSAISAPVVNRAIKMRRDELVADLQGLLPLGRMVHHEHGCQVYAADAFGGYSALPLAVVMPANVREVSQVMHYCFEAGLKVFPRGAGTSLTGGAVAAEDGIVLCLSRMNEILDLNVEDRSIRVQAGISNAAVSRVAAVHGLCFAPDPASRIAATIGGNIATNASGSRVGHVGATAQHVTAMQLVLVDGEVVDIGGGELEASGLDLAGLVIGSEGLLGVVVEATLQLVPMPDDRRLVLLGFQNIATALSCASGIAASRIQPQAVELIDREAIAVCEEYAGAGLPLDVNALLMVEIAGGADELADVAAEILQIADTYGPSKWLDIEAAAQVDQIWLACDSVFSALGRRGGVRCLDFSVPPSQLARAVAEVDAIASRYQLRGAHLCRAIDGIVRSAFLVDASPDGTPDDDTDDARVQAAIAEALKMAIGLGGSVSAEHGIGVAKRDMIAGHLESSGLSLHLRLKSVFDPEWLLGNGKVYPLMDAPGETSGMAAE
jgi:glycolate dehydrogenase FAD-linked subunit